jgi:hypothetical protein
MHAERFVKAQRGGVICPNVQRYVIAFLGACEIKNEIIQCLPNTFASAGSVYTYIVYIKSFYVGKDIIVLVLHKDAKGVAAYLALFVLINEDGSAFVAKYIFKLALRIFSCALAENIGARFMMYVKHLT